jgi:two-component system, NarL family, invasion response regulator UvrY
MTMKTQAPADTPRALRVLIADDHPVIRRGLREILEGAYGNVITGEATTSQEALDCVWKAHWDLVLLDITMPGRSGMDVLKEVRRSRPQLPVLILSVHDEEEYALRVIKAGAAGYVTKNKAPEVLLEAVGKVLGGGKYISPALAERLAAYLQGGERERPHEALSDREFEVMRLLASGKTVSAVAVQLALSVKTVSTYRTRIMEKMKMQTNADLTKYAMANSLID